MTVMCPWVTCRFNSLNKLLKSLDLTATNLGECTTDNITLLNPNETESFKHVNWGKIEPDDLLICTTYERNWQWMT